MPSAEFLYWGEPLEYCRAEYNNSARNERTVEVPIASRFVDLQRGVGLEVGNVLSHYRRVGWTVVDRYERGRGVLNIDVFDCHERYDWIVSISTLEHVRWDEGAERDPDGAVRAVEHLLGLLRPGGEMLVTVPMGWHPFLDTIILDHWLPREPRRECTMVRDGDDWVQTPELTHRRYAGTSAWADSVWIGEFTKERG